MAQTTDLTQSSGDDKNTAQSRRIRMSTPVDVYENENELLVVADLPGVEANQVDVRLDGRSLVIEAWQSETDPPGRYHLFEFQRAFRVPDTVDPNGVKAELSDGVLRLHLAKSEAARLRRIPVTKAD